MKLKQKAADKAARKAARQNQPAGTAGKGPPIDWNPVSEDGAPIPGAPDPASPPAPASPNTK